jgi:hypothetical protein
MKIRDVPQTGSLGETVTYQSRYGQVRRRKIIPRNPRTRLQMECRAAFERAREFWGTLTDEQFLAWDRVGRQRRTRAVLGRSSRLSGYLVSVSVNAHLAMIGLPMVPDPPPIPEFPVNPVVRLMFGVPPGGKRIFIQTLQQINGWRDRPKTTSARVPAA